jgi:hypothetical protein
MAQADASHSGRLLLRMPKALHAALAQRADAENVSLNQLIVRELTDAMSGEAKAPGQTASPDRVPRALQRALIANAVVVAFAACACIAILVIAWR